jgi:hypothetical protein
LQPHLRHRPWTTPCVISQRADRATPRRRSRAQSTHSSLDRPGSRPPRASPTEGPAQGMARSVSVARRRARKSPPVGVRAFAGKPSTRRSLDLAIVKRNEIAEEGVVRRCHRSTSRNPLPSQTSSRKRRQPPSERRRPRPSHELTEAPSRCPSTGQRKGSRAEAAKTLPSSVSPGSHSQARRRGTAPASVCGREMRPLL